MPMTAVTILTHIVLANRSKMELIYRLQQADIALRDVRHGNAVP